MTYGPQPGLDQLRNVPRKRYFVSYRILQLMQRLRTERRRTHITRLPRKRLAYGNSEELPRLTHFRLRADWFCLRTPFAGPAWRFRRERDPGRNNPANNCGDK